LQSILQDSNIPDPTGRSKRLYFYNMALGESYLVTIPPSGVSYTQTQDQNMIWNYNINMTILALLSEVSFIDNVESNNRNILSKGVMTKGVNIVANEVKSFLS